MFDFPNTPTVGQAYSSYVWDGEKWVGGGQGSTVYISDSAPAAPVGALWFESDTGILYIYYADGTSTQWVAIAAGGIDVGAVRFDSAQGLTAPQQVQARQNVYAAPFDAMAYSGLQINGGMEVSQMYGAASVPLTNSVTNYIVDGWYAGYANATAVMAGIQATTFGPLAVGAYFINAVAMYCTTAMSSVAAGDLAYLSTRIEGYRAARLGWGYAAGPQPITIGFWVYTTIAGTMNVSVNNLAGDRNYITEVSLTAATWQYKTITVPGCPDGTWPKDNTPGLMIYFMFACGTTFQTTPGSWVTTPGKYGTAACTNFFATAGNYAYITGVTILPGLEAPSAARSSSIMRPYDQEFITCERYLRVLGTGTLSEAISSGYAASAASAYGINYFTRMRIAPNPAYTAPSSYLMNFSSATANPAAVAKTLVSPDSLITTFSGTGFPAGAPCVVQANTTAARIYLDARL